MASEKTHLIQAKHNHKLSTYLKDDVKDYFDWVETCSFYAALHYIEAKFNTIKEVGHTETFMQRFGNESIQDPERRSRTAHFWRDKLINTHFSPRLRTLFSVL